MKTISQQIIGLSIIGSSTLLLPNLAQAITIEEVTNPRENNGGWVTDMADILSSQTELKLNQIIDNLEATNGTEIAVVTVPDINSHSTPKKFTTELFNYWGIGKADVDNGLLFLISTGDRRIEIETGYGIEPILSNTEVKKIIDTKITPKFKQGNYDRGTLAGTKALSDRLQTEVDFDSQEGKSLSRQSIISELQEIWRMLFRFILILAVPASIPIAILILIYLSVSSKNSSRKKRSRYYGSSSHSFGGGSSCGSGAGSSFGGGSFGGGSSGGGGSGGGW